MVKFLIVMTGYNWRKYIKSTFDSVHKQTYKNYSIAVCDDGSIDNSINIIDKEILKFQEWRLCRHDINKGTIHARNTAIRFAMHYDVIVLLDGDDQLLPNALQLVAEQYKDPNVLMTYGNYQFPNGQVCPVELEYSENIHKDRDYRKDVFRCTHLRTFKRELFEAVPQWRYTKSEIESYPDVEYLFSMMEMAGKDRMRVVKEPIYIYNTDNPDRTLKRFGKDQVGYNEIISRPKLNLL